MTDFSRVRNLYGRPNKKMTYLLRKVIARQIRPGVEVKICYVSKPRRCKMSDGKKVLGVSAYISLEEDGKALPDGSIDASCYVSREAATKELIYYSVINGIDSYIRDSSYYDCDWFGKL